MANAKCRLPKGNCLFRLCLVPFALCIGCVGNRAQIERDVFSSAPPPAYLQQVAAAYRARCPDVVRVEVDGLPQYNGQRGIGPDGRIELSDGDRPRVDGQTTAEIAVTTAASLGLPPQRVHVAVVEYNSQYLYLYGQIAGQQRMVPYRGPETVVDVLRRAGGVARGSDVFDVHVVRPHIADGKVPEVFRIDLSAIVVHHDGESNVIVEPCDQIYVGQSRRAHFEDCLPPWLRPIYEHLCGLKHRNSRNPS